MSCGTCRYWDRKNASTRLMREWAPCTAPVPLSVAGLFVHKKMPHKEDGAGCYSYMPAFIVHPTITEPKK